jgi:hypothetical protein
MGYESEFSKNDIFHMEDLHPYRAPTGIFLGFMLNFTSSWIKDAFAKNIFKDVVVAIGGNRYVLPHY